MLDTRPDGYHNLQSLFVPVPELHDTLEIIPSEEFHFEQNGIAIDGDPEQNLVVRAYRLLQKHFRESIPAVSIRLTKTIPTGAGLGGGSSDATFTLRMLNDIASLNLSHEQLRTFAAQLGADCPFFVENRPAYVTGIGDILQPIDLNLKDMGFMVKIEKPDVFVSTREAYQGLLPYPTRLSQHSPMPLIEAIKLPVAEWRAHLHNDFEDSIIPHNPAIGKLIQRFYDQGALYAAMSGSGSAVFGIFKR